jgi:hypothetical protein
MPAFAAGVGHLLSARLAHAHDWSGASIALLMAREQSQQATKMEAIRFARLARLSTSTLDESITWAKHLEQCRRMVDISGV